MARWSELHAQAPDLASAAAERFGAHKHCLIATLRPDGSPRLSGIEVWFWEGDLWLGMMPDSAKGADLRRDGRFELHSAPLDLRLTAPDARVWGTAQPIDDEATIQQFVEMLPHPSSGDMGIDLFRVEVTGAATVAVEGKLLVMETWRPGETTRRHSRR